MLLLIIGILVCLFSVKKRTRKVIFKVMGIFVKIPLYIVKIPFRIIGYYFTQWKKNRIIQKRADAKVELQRRKIETRLEALQKNRDQKKAAAQKTAAAAKTNVPSTTTTSVNPGV
jgi:hypothetical protein